jgi:hypothetical protein
MPFIAFPHQYSDLIKLRRILGVIHTLLIQDRQPTDEVLGYDLLASGVIGARRFAHLPLEQQIQAWQRLPSPLQTPRTTARDLRRMFKVFGLLEEFPTNNYALTDRGERIVRCSRDSLTDDEVEVWANALLNLKFYSAADDEHINANFRARPFVIMLHLLAGRDLENRLLAFAMSALSEEASAIRRIETIVEGIASGTVTLDQALATEGISRAQAANLVKILPSIGEQLGLIERRAGISSITDLGRTFLTNAEAEVPLWYRDLPGRGVQRERIAAAIATLAQGDVEEQAFSQVLSNVGYSLSQAVADLGNLGIQVRIANGFISTEPALSFDFIQDVPPEVRHAPAFSTFGDLLGTGIVSLPSVLLTVSGTTLRSSRPRPAIRRRRFRGSRDITDPTSLTRRIGESAIISINMDPLDRARRIELLRERTVQHQQLVALMSELYLSHGLVPREGDFDLVAETSGVAVLHEMKTLTDTNERLQVIQAVGQLFYYEHFIVGPEVGPGIRVEKAVVFDRPPADQAHIDYLATLGIHVYWRTSTVEIDGSPQSVTFLRTLLGI